MNAPSAANQSGNPDPRFWQWAGLCAVGLAGFALLAARAPERVRLIGLFAVGFGAVAGWGMAYAAKQFELRITWRLTFVATALIASAEVGLTLEMWRLYSAELTKIFTVKPEIEIQQRRSPAVPVTGAILLGFASKTESPANKSTRKSTSKPSAKTGDSQLKPPVIAPGELLQRARDDRLRELARRTRFAYYLRNRLTLFVEMSTSWAVVFWIGEVLLGSIAGGWLFRRGAT